MVQQGFSLFSSFGVFHQTLTDEVVELCAEHRSWPWLFVIVYRAYHVNYLFARRIRILPSCQLQNHHPDWPNVARLAVADVYLEPFRPHVSESPYECIRQTRSLLQLPCDPEVAQFYQSLAIHQHVFRLYVSVDLMVYVQMLQAFQHLSNHRFQMNFRHCRQLCDWPQVHQLQRYFHLSLLQKRPVELHQKVTRKLVQWNKFFHQLMPLVSVVNVHCFDSQLGTRRLMECGVHHAARALTNKLSVLEVFRVYRQSLSCAQVLHASVVDLQRRVFESYFRLFYWDRLW